MSNKTTKIVIDRRSVRTEDNTFSMQKLEKVLGDYFAKFGGEEAIARDILDFVSTIAQEPLWDEGRLGEATLDIVTPDDPKGAYFTLGIKGKDGFLFEVIARPVWAKMTTDGNPDSLVPWTVSGGIVGLKWETRADGGIPRNLFCTLPWCNDEKELRRETARAMRIAKAFGNSCLTLRRAVEEYCNGRFEGTTYARSCKHTHNR